MGCSIKKRMEGCAFKDMYVYLHRAPTQHHVYLRQLIKGNDIANDYHITLAVELSKRINELLRDFTFAKPELCLKQLSMNI